MMIVIRRLAARAVIFFSPTLVFAQLPGADAALAGNQGPSSTQETTILNGRVLADGSSSLPQAAHVTLACANQVRAEAYSDSRGNFSLAVQTSGANSGNAAATGAERSAADYWTACEVYADVPGFRSDHVQLNQKPNPGSVQLGSIILHPVATENGSLTMPTAGKFTVSVTSLQAPEKARRAFEKGEQEERKGKWEAARDYFRSAIRLYPRYALAWLELGRLQVRQNSLVEAHDSFCQAVAQDSRLTDGYVELARVAAAQQNWKELAEVTDHIVADSPDSSAEYWFLNSAAYYNLGDLQRAEGSITRGLRLDARHEIPQMEYLYGLILGSKKDFRSAAEHIDTYLRLAPNAQDKQAAQNLLSAYEYRARLAETDQQNSDQ